MSSILRLGQVRAHNFFDIGCEEQGKPSEMQNKENRRPQTKGKFFAFQMFRLSGGGGSIFLF